ncbi:unnamed protein product [Trichogramma brassicae]|uniref:Uncharacterized protein n=1 Tax=Trichogramma brassicae TaxID=86971 RepID=A0A6H5IM19_9HYME|nr:unnamed protein product [Trichogramma brassicae]
MLPVRNHDINMIRVITTIKQTSCILCTARDTRPTNTKSLFIKGQSYIYIPQPRGAPLCYERTSRKTAGEKKRLRLELLFFEPRDRRSCEGVVSMDDSKRLTYDSSSSEYRNVEWDEDELTRFHDFLEESGLATRLRQPDSIDQVLADIFPAPVDNSEGHGRDRIAHLMDCMIELVEDVVRDHMGVSNRSPAVAAAAAAAAAAAEAAIQVGPSTSSSWPAGAEVAAAAEQSDDILEAISSVSPGMPSMDDFIDTAASLPATPRGALYSPPLPEREPTVDLNNSSLMEAIDRYDRSLDQLAAEANSQPSSSTTQSDPLVRLEQQQQQ